jgi:hypothetical protein
MIFLAHFRRKVGHTTMRMSHRDKVEWRQDQIKRLLAKGHYSRRQIATIL